MRKELEIISRGRPIWYTWLCANYNYNLDKLSNTFKAFVHVRKQLPLKDREIRSHKNLESLCVVLDRYFCYDKMKLNQDAGVICDDGIFIAYSPRTFEASYTYGSGDYCDQRKKEMYDFYTKSSVVVNIIKNNYPFNRL
jgi:hypothetical protein